MSQPAFDLDDVELDDPTNPTYTVGELADAINDRLRRGFRDGVWVRGEIDGLKQGGPHTYFSLVERVDGTKAVLNVQLFAPMKRKLTPLLKRNRLVLGDGMKVRIHGHLDFWAAGGRLGLKMAGLDPRYTLGEIAQTRDEVLRRLVAEGLLDANGRLPLPPVPLNVGVATSVESAAWHDFHDELARSGLGFRLAVADCRVQGDAAVPMVAGAIGTLARRDDLDVIVVIRGGGARNELAVFDAEPIARTIATAPVPVLTGLGHEVDRSVADEVAHTALKTPTACAAALVTRVGVYTDATERTWSRIVERSAAALAGARTDLGNQAHRIARRTHAALGRADERLAMRRHQLVARAPRALDRERSRVEDRRAQLVDRADRATSRAGDRLDVLAARVATVDPAVQLARGWSITRDARGAVVRSTEGLDRGASLVTTFVDGSVTSVIETVDPAGDGREERPS